MGGSAAGNDGVQLCSIQLTQFTKTMGALRGLPIGALCTVGPISPDQDIYIAGDGIAGDGIAIHHHHNPLSQHGIASYVTKFKSQSFRLHSKPGVACVQ